MGLGLATVVLRENYTFSVHDFLVIHYTVPIVRVKTFDPFRDAERFALPPSAWLTPWTGLVVG